MFRSQFDELLAEAGLLFAQIDHCVLGHEASLDSQLLKQTEKHVVRTNVRSVIRSFKRISKGYN